MLFIKWPLLESVIYNFLSAENEMFCVFSYIAAHFCAPCTLPPGIP